MRSERAGSRLLFDENLPWRVAAALRILDFAVSYVGDESASPPSPARGSSDEVVLDHAIGVRQTVVTSNLDMVLLCVQRRQNVVWIDPKGRNLRREELALLAFKNIRDWSQRLDASTEPVCLRVLRTKTEALALDEAASRVRDRMSRISRQRARSRHRQSSAELFPGA